MKELCVLVFLGINSWIDLRKKQVSLVTAVIFAATGVVLSWSQDSISLGMLVSLGIGGFFLGVSVLTQGAIGMGDGWLLLALALMLDLQEYLSVLLCGLMICALWGIVMLVMFRRSGKSEIPFVPFLFLGYVGGVLLW